MRFAKQASVVVGLISGVVGLFFLFFPQFRPERHAPTPDQSASVSEVALNPRIRRGNFLDYTDQKKLGLTKPQLAEWGASAFTRVKIVGYRGKVLTLEGQVVNATSGEVVRTTRDFTVTPPAESVTHRWWDWTSLPPGRGSYVMVVKVLDEDQRAAIACGQTRQFGGLGGLLPAAPPRVCEGS
jgi:hypothetical protein